MLRLILLFVSFLLCMKSYASKIVVSNENEILIANKNAKPGDTIVLKNGNWDHVTFKLNCKGEKQKPIVFQAEAKGKVIITGNSKLLLGGNYIVVDGLYFTNGFSGQDAVIKFSINKNEIANNCRVTNTVINDFNNPNRLDENYWVALYGKNNRLDHCTFLNKKNLGVLLAVILEDDRSRANYHSIDHNYFGFRIPLASNGGEIIRIGVSEHCEFNSNTNVVDNYFEKCDGETEIISIKSCQNIIKNNLFKECQGAVVLRHGNYNIIANNVFLGNNKKGTGGIRVINKGHLIVNNFFFNCKGTDFRSPLSIMNGVPNSPANRYVGVSDAVIANNSFFDCTPISFCEGKTEERSLQPKNVQFINNLFYTKTDTTIYHIYDDMSGIHLANNVLNKGQKNNLINGFLGKELPLEKLKLLTLPKQIIDGNYKVGDSIQAIVSSKIGKPLPAAIGYDAKVNLQQVLTNASKNCGANWFHYQPVNKQIIQVKCATAKEIEHAIEQYKNYKITIHLTGTQYDFTKSIALNEDVIFTSDLKNGTNRKYFSSNEKLPFLFEIIGNHNVQFQNSSIDAKNLQTKALFVSDTSGTCNHSNFTMNNCTIKYLNGSLLKASKNSLMDSILVTNCTFKNGEGLLFDLYEEVDKKGYYNVEKMKLFNNYISNHQGAILAVLRSGKDESTMGPLIELINNSIENVTNKANALILLNGVQHSLLERNYIVNCNVGAPMIEYKDEVRAAHILSKNNISNSGTVVKNEYVSEK